MEQSLPEGFKEEHNVVHGISDGGLLHIKIHRPEKKNALYPEMYKVIYEQLDMGAQNEQVKVVLVYGSNGNFSAGNDVNSFLSNDPPPMQVAIDMIWKYVTYPKPLVFFVQGCCVGIIAALSSWADFVYCSEDAYFLIPFMSLNLSPEGLSSLKYPELLGRRKANEMIFLEKRLHAKTALKHGFINGILKKEDMPATEPILKDIGKIPALQKLLSLDSNTMQRAKKLLLQAQDIDKLKQHNHMEQTTFYEAQNSPKFKETVQKYVEMMWKAA